MKKNLIFIFATLIFSLLLIIGYGGFVYTSVINNSFLTDKQFSIYFNIYLGTIFFVYSIIAIWFLVERYKKKSFEKAIADDIQNSDFESEFNQIYTLDCTSKLEQNRKKLLFKVSFCLLPIFFMFLISILVYSYSIKSKLFATVFCIFLFIGIPFLINKSFLLLKKYRKYYKELIVTPFLKFLYPRMNYKILDKKDSKKIELLTVYEKVKFDNERFNQIDADDYLWGVIFGNTYFNAADIHIKREYERERKVSVFNGFFAIIDYSEPITKHNIKIRNNILEHEKFINVQKTNNSTFNEYFTVSSENDIKLLTPDIMQLVLDFYSKTQILFDIVISNNNLYFRFHTGNILEPYILKKGINKESIFAYQSIFKFIAELSQKLLDIKNDY